MSGTPIHDQLMAERAAMAKARANALKPKKAPAGKETGITKTKAQARANNKGKTPTQRIKRGTK